MIDDYDIVDWVAQANSDQQEFREAVHTILAAIANDSQLRAKMVIKGGILLAIRYQSHRYTKDIDFSSDEKLEDLDIEQLTNTLNNGFIQTAEELEYGLDCRMQSCRILPPKMPDAPIPLSENDSGLCA